MNLSPAIKIKTGTGSPVGKLDRHDIWKIAKGGIIAIVGAGLLAGASWLQALPTEIDFGPWEAIAVALIQVAVNAIRKFATNHTI